MMRIKTAGITAALLVIMIFTGCAKSGQTQQAGDGVTANITAAENADVDLEQDPETEKAQEEEASASTDLFEEDGSMCTQYLRLTPPEEWEGHVNYHYFQEPDAGRYALDIMENDSMTATEGVGGAVFSIVVYETYPEERGMENASYLGMLTAEDGKFLYVFLKHFPGTQYTEGSEESYMKVANCESGIAGFLEGRNGYTFEPGKDPVKTEEQTE